MSPLAKDLTHYLGRCPGIAAAVRCATTFNPEASVEQMVAAGNEVGLNEATVRKQFHQARKEDREMEAAQREYEEGQ